MQQISPPTPGTDSSTTSTTSTTAANPNTDIATITDEVAVIEEVQETTEITSGGSDNNNQTAGGSGGGGMKISFSVTKQKTTQVVAKNKLVGRREQDEDDEEEDGSGRKRGILRLEDGIIVDSEAPQKKKAKVFVIPVLRLSSQSQIERLKKLVEDGTATEQDKARLALLLESMEEQGGEAGGQQQFGAGNDKIYLASSGAPTVVVPDDVDPDYDSMPVGEFGLAFLRGCGWKDERSVIGKTNAQAVPLRITAPRPKGLGLGAILPSAPPDIKKKVENAAAGGGEEDELKPLGKKSFVKCLGGLNKGSYGQVTSMDEENSSVFVELTWPPERAGKTVRISQWIVEVVSVTEHRAKTGGGMTHENGRHTNNKSREQRIRV